MPEFDTASPATLKLQMALLIYSDDGHGDDRAITRHQIKDGHIQPGEAIDIAALRSLLDGEKTTSRESFSWRSPSVLADSATRLVWWTPPGVKQVFIASKAKRVWFPGLVWCGHRSARSLYLWAFRGKAAPTKDTVVYRPRFGPDVQNHIHNNSAVCLGSMNPGRFRPEDWMTAFYDSNFKTDGNLPSKPYEIKTRFEKIGALSTAFAGLGSPEQDAD